MGKKISIFASNGEPMCFAYALMNAIDMKVKKAGLMDGVCRACARKMDSLESAKEQGLHLCDEMFGHPGMARYAEEGYEIIVF